MNIELEKSRVQIAALSERIKQVSENLKPAPSKLRNIFRLCISCAAKHSNSVLSKAQGLPPGTKCDECHGQAVMSVEVRTDL